MTSESELFDARFLSRLRTLFFKLRKRRSLKRKGSQAAPAAGFTREFKDRRRYTPGDDYRSIDWLLFARLERLFVRIFEEIQEFHIHILLDRSRSMVEPYPEKRVLALRLAVALAYLGLVSQHRVSILSLTDTVRRETPPLKGQGHIHEVLRQMAALEFGGATDLDGALRGFRPGRDRRGMIFLVSDLFGRAPESAAPALKRMLAWPAETHVIQILHPREPAPTLEGELRLVDVETGEARRLWLTRSELRRYRETFAAYQEELRETCRRYRADFVAWTTDQSFEEMFLNLLSRGSALAHA